MKNITRFTASAFMLLAIATATAQKSATTTVDYNQIPAKSAPITETDLKRWSHLDLVKDTIPGMSVDKAYRELLKKKKSTKVIVGVIDSGVDIEHEDLQSIIWTNLKEIPGNNIDDDKNGYVDDVHGWNFLGDATNETYEFVRILKKNDDGSELYKKAKAEFDSKYAQAIMGKQQADFIMSSHKAIAEYLKKPDYTLEEVTAITPISQQLGQAKQVMMSVLAQTGPDFLTEITAFQNQVEDMVNFNLNKDFDGRKIVGDDPENWNSRNYGNNNVIGPDKKHALHGTHVSGIIAQIRNNSKGGDGVADNVSILPIRAVPNGDEYDKDIALAIRYAVDNGAKVINGSFGKSFSPHKEWVYDAIKYAAQKDVLIVFGSGNDGKNIDLPENRSFPNDSENGTTEIASNVLNVGALAPNYNSELIANFSNYGKQNVDIFAPGVEIYATVPNNEYKFEDGTSMASPNAAGIAALVRSYYPKLSAQQVKQIIMDSGIPLTKAVNFGEEESQSFAQASKSGKMINAYNALLMAEKISKK